ncbi:MAG: periplasmic heavy metal sensor [Opitutales bacterium]
MKRQTLISLKSLFTTLVTGMVLLPLLATAQDRDDKPRPRPSDRPQANDRPSGQARPQGGQPRGDYFLMRFRSILSDEQGASLREKVEASRDTMSELGKKLLEKRRGMMGLVLAQPVDKKAIRAAFKEIGKLEGGIAIMRAEMIAAIKPPLSKEQLEKLKQPPRRPQGRPQQARPQQGRPSPDRPQRPPAERKSLDELIKRGESGGSDRPPRDRVPQRPLREPKPE